MKFAIPISIYGTELRVVVGNVQAAADTIARRHDAEQFDVSDADAFFCYPDKDYYLAIEPGVQDDVIVHECVHVATRILMDRGIRLTRKHDEPYAYLIQFLYREIQRRLGVMQ